MDIKSMLEKAIADVVRETLSGMDTDAITTTGEARRVRVADVVKRAAVRDEDSQPIRRRRTNPRGPSTVYVMQHDVDPDELNANAGYQDVWRAIRKAHGLDKAGRKPKLTSLAPLSEADIIKATKRTDASAQNAAQSAIWWLRNHNADGKRVKPGSSAALLVSERVERDTE